MNRWTVGYRAGARKADPKITVKIDYSQNFTNPAKCRAVALRQIAEGSGVVFNVSGACGLGALRAAKDEGVWGLGVDTDQSYLGPHILTSAVIRLDKGVVTVVQRFLRGKLAADRNSVFDLRNGGVGLGRISPKVERPFLRPPGDDPQGDHRRQDPGAAAYLARSAWVPTQTAPSPTATEIGCGATHTTRVLRSVAGSIRQR